MCGGGADESPHGLRVFEGRWADGYIGRYPVRPGYAYVVWKGRHVSEPSELSYEETAGFWADVARVARAVEAQFQPAKMNWLHLGNGVPHLHVHLVPRPHDDARAGHPLDDARAGHPLETEAFHVDSTPAVEPSELASQAEALRARLQP